MIARPTPALGPTPIPRGGGILPRMDRIVIRGAREHNLKNISLELPRGKFIVITGVSGSGKSTLAFDTIYAEGQRRYVESLSSYARQFLGVMDKPEVESIEGLSPAISIDQKTTSHNPRSTVGTVTEIHDYLRLLFARVGQAFCPECGRPIEKQSASEITDRLLKRPPAPGPSSWPPWCGEGRGVQEALPAAPEGRLRPGAGGRGHLPPGGGPRPQPGEVREARH